MEFAFSDNSADFSSTNLSNEFFTSLDAKYLYFLCKSLGKPWFYCDPIFFYLNSSLIFRVFSGLL